MKRCIMGYMKFPFWLAWVSGVSGEKGKKKNLLSPNPVGRPDTQATLWSRRYNLYIYIFSFLSVIVFLKLWTLP